MINKLKKDLREKVTRPEKAKIMAGFFKTGKGQYGEGDIFLGVTVPDQRKIAKKYKDVNLKVIKELLSSKIHEERLTGLLILLEKYKKNKKEIFEFYSKNIKYVNNWDLVDLTSHNIIGDYILNKNKDLLYKLAKSKNLWKKRIAIVSTYKFIKNNKFQDTIKISEILINDKHDLIHKATGWMLREVGKRNLKLIETFLNKHHKKMPRTMLRYTIEKFENNKKLFYMKK